MIIYMIINRYKIQEIYFLRRLELLYNSILIIII